MWIDVWSRNTSLLTRPLVLKSNLFFPLQCCANDLAHIYQVVSTVIPSFCIIYPRSFVLISCLASWKESLILGIKNIVCNSELLRWAVSHRNNSGLFLGLCVKCSTREKQIPSEVTDGNRNDVPDIWTNKSLWFKMSYGGKSMMSLLFLEILAVYAYSTH